MNIPNYDNGNSRFSIKSLRGRLVFLVLLAVFPFLILALYNGFAQRKQAARDVTEDVLRIVRQVRSELELPVEVARHLLTLLAKHPDVDQRRQGECIRTLKDLKIQFPMFNNFGVTDEQGNLYCSAVPSTGTVNMSDRLYFKGAKESGDFSGGDLQVGRNTGKHNIAYAYPILDKQKKFKGVVYMSIDPHAISRRLSQIPLSSGTEIRIIDRKGEILASNQDPKKWTGRDVSNEPFIKTILEKGEGTFEMEGLDKVRRLYAFTTLTSAGTKELHFYAGIPTSVAYRVADQALTFNLMVIGLIVLLALCGAWFGTNAMILRQIKILISAAQRLASGDLSARTGVSEGAEEVRLLAQTFDSLVETLEQQAAESRRTEEQFKRSAAEESGLADLGARLQGKLSVTEVAQRALESLVQFLEASMGTLFVLEEDGQLHRKADYALPHGLTEQTSFFLGSGSIGQVAQSTQMAITDAGNQTWRLTYGFGELTPSQIVTFPLLANEILIGVVELCFYDEFSEDQKEWLSKASVMVATALRFARESRERDLAEERIQRIIEFMPNPVMVIDNQGRVVFWNRSMERITGMKKEVIIGKGDYEYALPFYGVRRPILVDLVGRWNEEIAEKYLSIKKEGDLLISESYHPHLGEGGSYLLSMATVFYDAAGQPSGAMEILRDITEQKRSEALMVEKEVAEEAAVKAEKARQEALAAQEELRVKIEEVERFNRLALGREERILDLKQQMNVLALRAGMEKPYKDHRDQSAEEKADLVEAKELEETEEVELNSDHLAEILAGSQFTDQMNGFWNMVGIPAAIIDLEGRVLAASPWQKACTDFHRTNAITCARCIESDTELALKLNEGQPFSMYRCKNGLTDCASPIFIGGKHVANAFVGQFFIEPPDLEFFRKQAAECGLAPEPYLAAIAEVPIIAEERLPAILNFMLSMAQAVVSMSVERLRAQRAEALMARRAEETTRERVAALSLAEDAEKSRKEIEQYKGRLEQLVADRTEELKISEERSRQLLESAGEGIFGLDAQGHLTLINPAALRMLGFSEAELMGRDIHPLIHHSHPDGSNYSAEECLITDSFIKGTTHHITDEVLWRKDGSPFPVEYSSTPIRKDGRVVGAVVTFRDVSERRRVDEERRQYVEELEGFNKLIVGREEKMIELKEEINDLLVKMGLEKKYKIPDEEE